MAPKINYLLEKLYEMDKKLGGREHINEKKKNYDEFSGIKEMIINSFFEIRKKFDQKQQSGSMRTNDTIKLELEVKDKMAACSKNISKMNEYLKKNRSKDQQLFEKRQKIYDSLYLQYNTFNQMLFNKSSDLKNESGFSEPGGDTSSRNGRLLGAPIEKRGGGGVTRDLSDIEKDGMREIEENDKQTDDLLDQLNDGVLRLKVKAEQIGESIDHTIQQCKNLEQEMIKTENVLVSSNEGLKKILKHYRSPSKCCLDFVLLIIFLGMGVTIYYQLK